MVFQMAMVLLGDCCVLLCYPKHLLVGWNENPDGCLRNGC